MPPFVALGAMPMRVLRNAYAAAPRRPASSVGTLDVLAQVAVYEKQLPPWLLAGPGGGLRRMAVEPGRIPGGRSAGEISPGPDTDVEPEVRSVLRETEWRARRLPGTPPDAPPPGWTSGVAAMLAGALAAAPDTGVPYAGLGHLLLGMLHVPGCDATRYLFPYETARAAAVERLRTEPGLRRTDEPHPELDDVRLALWPRSGSLIDRLGGRLLARASRLARIGPLFVAVEPEARRQAVRLGHDVVGPAHVLLALLTVDATLEAAGIPVPAHHSSRNRGASVLRAYGVVDAHLRDTAARRGAPEQPPAEALAGQLKGLRPGDPVSGAATVAAMERAAELSLACRHPDTGTGHLLLALLEDDAGDAAAVLRDLGIDPAAVRDRVEHDLRAAPAAWPARDDR